MLEAASRLLEFLLVAVKDASPYIFGVLSAILAIMSARQSIKLARLRKYAQELLEQQVAAHKRKGQRRIAQYERRLDYYQKVVKELEEERRRVLEYLANTNAEARPIKINPNKEAEEDARELRSAQ